MLKLHRILPALGLLLLAAAPLQAQDAQQLFEEGMRAFQSGDNEAALARFREVVRMSPDDINAQRMVMHSQDALLMLLWQGGEFETFAKHILTAASNDKEEALRDRAAATEVAERCLTGDYESRAKARFELVTTFGPFGVPPLVNALGSGNEERRLAATYALSRMGTEMSIPLIAATYSSDKEVRAGAMLALGNLDDPRAKARLADMAANDPDGVVRKLAQGFKVGGNPGDLYFRQGMGFYANDLELGLTGPENHGVMWTVKGPRLDFYDVPAALVPLELARWSFLQAGRTGNPDGTAGVALSYAAELATIESLMASGHDDLQADWDKLYAAALSLSQDSLDAALRMALSRNEPSTAALLARLLDRPGLARVHGLEQALTTDAPNLRYFAAIALANAGRRDTVVVDALGGALRLQALRVVHIMDNDAARRSKLTSDLVAQGVAVVTANDAAGGLVNLYRSVDVDAFVIADPLPDFYARRVVAQIRKDPRHEDAPILVIANDQTGDIEGATTSDSVDAEMVIGAFPELDAGRRQHLRTAERAAEALAYLARIDGEALSGVAERLAVAAGRDHDGIAVPAMRALGFVGQQNAYSALSAVVGDEQRSVEARTAAADAIAVLLTRLGWRPESTGVLEQGYNSEDAALRNACARALAAAGAEHRPAWAGEPTP